jgi:hypothetical protein
VISNVVGYWDFLNLSKLGKLTKYFLIKLLKVVHSLNKGFLRDVESICKGYCSGRVVIEMWEA